MQNPNPRKVEDASALDIIRRISPQFDYERFLKRFLSLSPDVRRNTYVTLGLKGTPQEAGEVKTDPPVVSTNIADCDAKPLPPAVCMRLRTTIIDEFPELDG